MLMNELTLTNIAKNYNYRWPIWPPICVSGNWLYGMWMIGQDYRNKSDFYGAYPASYLEHINTMFPNQEKVLHLFSGILPKDDSYIRFDMIQNCDVSGDAHKLSEYFCDTKFDLISADPPYSGEDADKYGTPMINRNKVVSECSKILKPNGYLVWLDCVFPMHRKSDVKFVGTIGLIRSTNHRFRVVSIFRKQDENLEER